MENGTLRMGILKPKGLRPLVQNLFPFATKTFSKIRGILELNQTKSANGTRKKSSILISKTLRSAPCQISLVTWSLHLPSRKKRYCLDHTCAQVYLRRHQDSSGMLLQSVITRARPSKRDVFKVRQEGTTRFTVKRTKRAVRSRRPQDKRILRIFLNFYGFF